MVSVALTEEQKALYDRLQDLLKHFQQLDSFSPIDRELFQEMGSKAHQLHTSLTLTGNEPVHHQYMIKNRGLAPSDPNFYLHIHPVEDLLKFIANRDANRDPTDLTLGYEFKFRVYTRRWQHIDTYRLTRIDSGWYLKHKAINGDCDKAGHPFLYMNFRQDYVNYPHQLPDFMESLWEDAAQNGLSEHEVQDRLDALANWVSICERETPEFV